MTTVLLLLYLADLVLGVSGVCAIAAVVMLCVWCVRWLSDLSQDYGKGAAMRTMPNKRLLWVVLLLFSVVAIMPSRTTMYAVAAVQAGDAFSDSERGSKVLSAVDRWLDDQITTEED